MQWRKVCVVSGGRGSDASREYTCYHISCTESGERGRSWTVTQRYSVFEALRQQLLSSADERLVADIQVILPTAPGVSNEGGSSPLLALLLAVSWPWVPAWGSLEPSRQDGENAQKTEKNGEKRGNNGRDTA